MSDALPLPPRPDLDQYRKLARELLRAARSGDAAQVDAWARRVLERLADSQAGDSLPDRELKLNYATRRLAGAWRRLVEARGEKPPQLSDAQFFLARMHGFPSWPKFMAYVQDLAQATSQTTLFESAADAIVSGDLASLSRFLSNEPKLAHARSARAHRSTLLHYVSANGVEDFRQKTPPNIVEIARLLLDSGADVNAESEAYGGGSTTLGLAATSYHPEEAGVQIALLDLLLARGASLNAPDTAKGVVGCLRNGRGEAARFLADRGARLDLEGAAGVGRLDVVRSFFADDGALKPPATEKQRDDGFAWACEFGRTEVVAFLLDRGVPVDLRLPHNRQTGLHWAAYGGHAATVRLLLDRGADPGAKDESFQGTPLEWAVYQWGNSRYSAARGSYYEVVSLLARAGSTLDPEWAGDDPERRRAMQKAHSDPRMVAALRGEDAGG